MQKKITLFSKDEISFKKGDTNRIVNFTFVDADGNPFIFPNGTEAKFYISNGLSGSALKATLAIGNVLRYTGVIGLSLSDDTYSFIGSGSFIMGLDIKLYDGTVVSFPNDVDSTSYFNLLITPSLKDDYDDYTSGNNQTDTSSQFPKPVVPLEKDTRESTTFY